jgi:hypothetical protein
MGTEEEGIRVATHTVVMAGLDPAIHVLPNGDKDVDARDKRGHDEARRGFHS